MNDQYTIDKKLNQVQPTKSKEELRVEAVYSLRLVDTLAEKEFDAITALAANICKTPISLVTLVTEDRQFFKSHHGIDVNQTLINQSFCAQAIKSDAPIYIVEDVREHQFFKDSPLVKTNPQVVFYAGVPLINKDGHPLGTLCVIDREKKSLDQFQIDSLKNLATQVVQLFDLRLHKIKLEDSQKELKEESIRLNNIIEATQVGTWEWNLQSGEIRINERWAEMIGYSKAEIEPITTENVYCYFHPDDRTFSKNMVQECFERKLAYYNIDCRLIHKNGQIIWIQDRGQVTKWSKDMKPLMMSGTHTDITQRKEAENQVKMVSDNLPGVVFQYKLNANGSDQLLSVSKGAEKVWGFPAKEIIEDTSLLWSNYHEDDVKEMLIMLEEAAKHHSSWEHEFRYHHPDGSLRWFRGSGNPHQSNDRSKIWDSIILDITEKKQAELELTLKEDRFRKLIENSEDATAIISAEGKTTYVSSSITNVLGYTEKEAYQLNLTELIHPEDFPFVSEIIEQAIEKAGIPQKSKVARAKHKNGSWRYIEATITSMLHEPSINGIIDNFRDVTDKVIANQMLTESEQRFRSLMQEGSDLIAILNFDGELEYVSPNYPSVSGYEENYLLGKNIFDFFHLEDVALAKREFEQLAKNERIKFTPYRFKNEDGSYSWLQSVCKNLFDENSIRGIVINSHDITDLIKSQQKLKRHNQRFEYVNMATNDAIYEWDIQSNKVYWGDSFQRIFGYQIKEKTFDIKDWEALVHPSDIEETMESLNQFLTDQKQSRWVNQYRFRNFNQDYAFVEERGYVIRDQSGEAIRMIGVLSDISIRKKEEEEYRFMEKVINETSDAVLITEANPMEAPGPRIKYLNPAFTKMSGYSREELIGENPRILQGPKTDHKQLAALSRAMSEGKSFEVTTVNYKKMAMNFGLTFQ